MSFLDVKSFVKGRWIAPDDNAREIEHAITGRIMGRAGTSALDTEAMLSYAKTVGGPALRALSFHDRARMVKALALSLNEHKQSLYDLSYATGVRNLTI